MRFLVQPVLRLLLVMAFFALLVRGRPTVAQAPQAGGSSALPEAQIREAAARILKNTGKADCKGHDCRIAVANFTFASGLTSQLGMALADQFSQALATQKNAVSVVDRAQFRSDLERQRIPGELLNNEKALRWLGHAMGATAVLAGTIEQSGASVRVRAHLMSCQKDKAGPEESIVFSYAGPPSDLEPTEAFAPKPQSTDAFSSPAIREVGKGGVKPPKCVYCRDPSYSEPARRAKFSGTAVMEVVVTAEGQTGPIRIARGLPFGLNESAMEAVRGWRFTPATLNGEPVTVKVMIEVMFRLY
ncbi:MAG TPA: energy transducer TonB [Methylomirabilota bacterium]|nr:energy transducer TonB [Methylomirabilota bacterium]